MLPPSLFRFDCVVSRMRSRLLLFLYVTLGNKKKKTVVSQRWCCRSFSLCVCLSAVVPFKQIKFYCEIVFTWWNSWTLTWPSLQTRTARLLNVYEGRFRTSEEECRHQELSFLMLHFITISSLTWNAGQEDRSLTHTASCRPAFWTCWNHRRVPSKRRLFES